MFKHRSTFPALDRLYNQNIALRRRLVILAITIRRQQQKTPKHFQEEKCNINKSKCFLYFLQNSADLRTGMGKEKKKRGRRSCGKVILFLFQRAGIGSTN